MVKAIFSLAAALSVFGIGLICALKTQKRVRALTLWHGALTRIEGALRFAAFSPPQALAYAAQGDMPLLETLSKAMQESPTMTAQALFHTLMPDEALTQGDRQILSDAMHALALYTVSEQCAALQLSISRLEASLKAARDISDKNAKLYASGGVLGGAALLILLL